MQTPFFFYLSTRTQQFSQRYPQIFLLLWVFPLLVWQGHQQSFMAHDEGIYAYQARQIVEGGNWLRPGGDYNYDRAIGIQWIIAVCFHLFGQGEWIARLPSMLGAIVTLLLTYRIGCKLLNPSLGLVGSLILSVTPLWAHYSRLSTQDMMLLAVELLGIWAFLEGEDNSRSKSVWAALGASTFGVGFWIKGFMIIPAGIAFAPYLVMGQRRHRYLTTPAFYVGAILGLMPVTLWVGLSIQRYGWLPLQGLFGKLFILSKETFNNNGPLFYIWNIPANTFPWIFWTLMGGALVWRKLKQPEKQSELWLQRTSYRWILLGYPLLLLLELTIFKTRTPYYALQLIPFFSLLAAIGLADAIRTLQSRLLPHWLVVLSYSWSGLTLLLIMTGGVLLMPSGFSKLDPSLHPFGAIALGVGLGWLGIPIAQLWIQRKPESPHVLTIARLWGSSWLLGVWIGLILFGVTGVWGNYNPKLKTLLDHPPIQEILRHHTVKMVELPPQASANDHKISLLLKFYVYHLDPKQLTSKDLNPSDYAWIPPSVDNPPRSYKEIGSVQGWRLVKIELDRPIPSDHP